MNIETGAIEQFSEVEALKPEEQKKYVPISRPLTVREYHKQKINKYAPCEPKTFKSGCPKPKKTKQPYSTPDHPTQHNP